MKRQPLRRRAVERGVAGPSVKRVEKNRHLQSAEVDPDLMLPAGQGPHLQARDNERVARPHPIDTVVRRRGLGGGVGRTDRSRLPFLAACAEIDAAGKLCGASRRRRRRRPSQRCAIRTPSTARGGCRRRARRRPARTCHGRSDAPPTAARRTRVDERVQAGIRRLTAGRDDRNASRLVDDDELRVFVDDAEAGRAHALLCPAFLR